MAKKLTDEQLASLNDPSRPRVAYIVWNDARNEGYVTFDKQVAYEARKGAHSNCYDRDGNVMRLAQTFCETYSDEHNATMETVLINTLED